MDKETLTIEDGKLIIETAVPEKIIPATIERQEIDIEANDKVIISMIEAIKAEDDLLLGYQTEHDDRVKKYTKIKDEAEALKLKYQPLQVKPVSPSADII